MAAEELAYLAWIFGQVVGHIRRRVEGHDPDVSPRDGSSKDGTKESHERDEQADAAAERDEAEPLVDKLVASLVMQN